MSEQLKLGLGLGAGLLATVLVITIAFKLAVHYTVFSGVVVNKRYEQAWAEHTTRTNDTTGRLDTSTYRHPEHWALVIEGYNKAGNLSRSEWPVPEHTYNDVAIGDEWSTRE